MRTLRPRTFLILVLALCAWLRPDGAGAGTLAPKRASDLVTLAHGSFPGCGLGNAYPLNVRLSSDGTSEPFEVPAKRSLVVTRASFRLSADDGAVVTLKLGTNPNVVDVAQTSGPSDLFGEMTLEFDFGSGIAVGPGQPLCVLVIGINTPATLVRSSVHGFLVPAK